MTKSSQINFSKFLNNVKVKKQYIDTLKNRISMLNNVKKKSRRNLNFFLEKGSNPRAVQNNSLVMYILDISFFETNTFLHVMSPDGNLIFFCSAGNLNYKGKQKKLRFVIFRDLFRILVSKLRFLRKTPIALHLKNVDSNRFWILKKLKKRFYIKVVRSFSLYPHNGCRKKKMRRKKFKIKA
jgi:ribosomal protein S11